MIVEEAKDSMSTAAVNNEHEIALPNDKGQEQEQVNEIEQTMTGNETPGKQCFLSGITV